MKLIGDVARKIGSSIKKLFMFIVRFFVLIWIGLKKVTHYIINTVKRIAFFVWDKVLKYPWIFIRNVSKKIYKGLSFIFKKIEILVKPIFKFFYNILKFIWKIIRRIGLFFFDIFKYIFRFFKWLFYKIIDIINFIADKFILGLIKIYRFLKRMFIGLINFFKYGFRSFPDKGYRFSMNGLIYILLIFQFILYLIPKFIIITIPYNVFNVVIKGLNPILTFIYNGIKKLFNIIKKTFMFLYELILNFLVKFSEQIYLLLPYYYVVLLSPIVLPIFIFGMILAFLYSLIISIRLFVIAILGIKYINKDDSIYLKPLYNPMINLFIYSDRYHFDIKYLYSKTTKLKNGWVLVNLIVWQMFFKYLIIPILSIVLVPLTIISSIYYWFKSKSIDVNSFIEKRIIIIKTNTNGIIKKFNYKFFGRKISIEILNAYYDKENKIFISTEDVNLSFKYLNEVIKTITLSYNENIDTILLKEFMRIKHILEKENKYQFQLPQSNNLKVTYETTRRDDIIDKDHFILRYDGTNARIKIKLEKENTILEREIEINNIINTRLINQTKLNNQTILFENNSNFKKVLDKRLNYEFIASENIDSSGNIKTNDDKEISISFYVKEIPSEIYTANVFVKVRESKIKNYLEQLETPIFNIEDKKIIYKSKIDNFDRSSRNVTWFINGEELFEDDDFFIHYRYYGKQKKYNAAAIFTFNNKLVTEHFEFENPTDKREIHFDYEVSTIINSISYLEYDGEINFKNKTKVMRYFKKASKAFENKKYLYLPIFGNGYVFVMKWKSLNPEIINSSGKIYKETKDTVVFELTMYRNIFVKKKYLIKMINE